ncbi:hypothetical protein WI372_07660 [Gemmatimonadota bacterium DH-20]|uniref:Uncharacterized protein n=1 Tax=Gaopeijia maritima TaxID=3119007 RepID=A0ABU9E806_9BACT
MAFRCLSCMLLLAALSLGWDARPAAAQAAGFVQASDPALVADEVPDISADRRTLLWRGAWAAAATTAIAYGLMHDEIVIECGAPAPGDQCPSQFVLGERSTRPHLTAGFVVGGLALVAGWLHTRDGNDVSMSESRVLPRVHGPGRLSIVRIPLQGGVR